MIQNILHMNPVFIPLLGGRVLKHPVHVLYVIIDDVITICELIHCRVCRLLQVCTDVQIKSRVATDEGELHPQSLRFPAEVYQKKRY